MARRILIAEMKQETATFNPAKTLYDDFHVLRGDDLLDALRGTKTEIGGALDFFAEAADVEVVPTISARAVSGGPIEQRALDRLIGELTDAAQRQSDIDAAYLCLHGAMASETNVDPEGTLLTRIREILGDVSIVVSLDLHAVLTDAMVHAADVLVPFHTYPHIDQYETGQRAAQVLLRLLEGVLTPSTARVELPMLVRGDELITATGRFGDAIEMCRKIESSEDGLAAGVIIGNAFTDVPDLQSNVLVTTEDDPETARREAERIARFMWRNRELFQAELTPLEEAIDIACVTSGLTVFSDAADATASGAPGDSNAILKGLLDAEYSGRVLMTIVDAPAVEQAFCAGIGTTIVVSLGGTRDPGRFTPVTVTARVKSLADGEFRYEDGTLGRGGRTAVLAVGNINIVVTERSVYVVGRKVFLAQGLDPRDYDVVVVKSPNGFRTWYEEIAATIVPVDVPGATSANLKSLPYRRCVRPIFPLDEDVSPRWNEDD